MLFGFVHGDLIRFWSYHQTQTIIAVDGCHARFLANNLDLRSRIDSAQFEHFEIGMQTRHAVRVDAAKVASRQDVGGLFGIRFWDAEMHEHLSGKIPKVSIRKYLQICLVGKRAHLAQTNEEGVPVSTTQGSEWGRRNCKSKVCWKLL